VANIVHELSYGIHETCGSPITSAWPKRLKKFVDDQSWHNVIAEEHRLLCHLIGNVIDFIDGFYKPSDSNQDWSQPIFYGDRISMNESVAAQYCPYELIKEMLSVK
jgi:hypothetical protein